MHVPHSVQLFVLPFILVTCAAPRSVSCLSLQLTDESRKPPQLDQSLVNKVFDKVLGDSVLLPCPVVPRKGLFFEWSNNGHTIDEVFSSSRFKVDDETGELSIRKLKLTDSGVYVCHATNGFGFVAGYVELHVMTLEAKRLKDGIHENKVPNKNAAEGRRSAKVRASYKPIPVHPRVEEERFAYTGQDISFVFTAKGIPQPKFWWYFRGQSLAQRLPSTHFREETAQVASETMQTTLTLFNVTSKLAGRYSVRALNEKGLTEAVFRLDVYPLFKSQIIGEYPVNITVAEGGQLKMPCRMRAHAEPRIQWIKRSEPLLLHRDDSEHLASSCSQSGDAAAGMSNAPPPTAMDASSQVDLQRVPSSASSPSSDEVSSIISSNTITLRTRVSPGSSSGPLTASKCKNTRRRKLDPSVSPERRAGRLSPIGGKSTLQYIGDNVYENLLTIDKLNASHSGYYICFSYTSSEYRQVRVDISLAEENEHQSMQSVILLSTRHSSSASFSTVTSLTHGNFAIAFHAIFWLIGSVIFLCCMACILFMLSIRKSLQPSSQSHAVNSWPVRSKRNHSSALSTEFAEAEGNFHACSDLPIALEPMSKASQTRLNPSDPRHRTHLTQVVVENHLPPKNATRNHCSCSLVHEGDRFADSKVLSSLNAKSAANGPRGNIYTIGENCDQWSMVLSRNHANLGNKCSLCNQSINSSPSGRSIPHLGNYYSNERASRLSLPSRPGANYDSDEITVIN